MNYRATLIEHLKKEKLEQLNHELKAYETFTDAQLTTLLAAFKENRNSEYPKPCGETHLQQLKEFKEKLFGLEMEFMSNAVERVNT